MGEENIAFAIEQEVATGLIDIITPVIAPASCRSRNSFQYNFNAAGENTWNHENRFKAKALYALRSGSASMMNGH